MPVELTPEIYARLSIQRALLGEVSAQTRAVIFSIKENCLDIRFYFAGPISEDDKESVSCVEAEILADYDPGVTVATHCIRQDPPNIISDDGIWVFLRKEP
jgi:hypothetical protein